MYIYIFYIYIYIYYIYREPTKTWVWVVEGIASEHSAWRQAKLSAEEARDVIPV